MLRFLLLINGLVIKFADEEYRIPFFFVFFVKEFYTICAFVIDQLKCKCTIEMLLLLYYKAYATNISCIYRNAENVSLILLNDCDSCI